MIIERYQIRTDPKNQYQVSPTKEYFHISLFWANGNNQLVNTTQAYDLIVTHQNSFPHIVFINVFLGVKLWPQASKII